LSTIFEKRNSSKERENGRSGKWTKSSPTFLKGSTRNIWNRLPKGRHAFHRQKGKGVPIEGRGRGPRANEEKQNKYITKGGPRHDRERVRQRSKAKQTIERGKTPTRTRRLLSENKRGGKKNDTRSKRPRGSKKWGYIRTVRTDYSVRKRTEEKAPFVKTEILKVNRVFFPGRGPRQTIARGAHPVSG